MRSTGLDAFTSGEIFRKNFKIVIATKRELALIRPVRLAPKVASDTSIYYPGQTLARYTSGPYAGQFVDYSDAGASGRETATCILLSECYSQAADSAASAPLAQALFKGVVFKDALIGWDAAAKTDVNGRQIDDAQGISLIEF